MKNYYLFLLAFLTASTAVSAQCTEPTGFNINRDSDTQATITVNETDPTLKYDLYVDLYGNRAPDASDNAKSNFHNLSMPYTNYDLIPQNEYSVWIRQVCDNGNSQWVGPVNLLRQCEEPVGFNIDRVSPTEVLMTVNSTDASLKYDLYVDLKGNAAPSQSSNAQSNFHNLSMPYGNNTLDPNTEYSVWIRQVCGSNLNSDWVGPVDINLFNAGCVAPNVTANRTSSTSAVFGTDANHWDMYVDIFNTAPANTSNPQSTYNNKTGLITNNSLDPSKTYYLWFRSDCDIANDNTDVSDWDGPYILDLPARLVNNSATGLIKVENFKVKNAQVVNINGRVESTTVINNEINTSNLTPGQYILNVTDADGNIESLQFIKK